MEVMLVSPNLVLYRCCSFHFDPPESRHVTKSPILRDSPLEGEQAQGTSCRHEDAECLKEFQKEGEGCRWEWEGVKDKPAPAGPGRVA